MNVILFILVTAAYLKGVAAYTTIEELKTTEEPKPLYHEVTATSGSVVTLKCKTKHDIFDQVTWYRNDSKEIVALKDKQNQNVHQNYSKRISFEDDGSLVVRSCILRDDSFYYCVTKDSNNTEEQGEYIKLTVQEKPSCDFMVSNVVVINGTIAHLSCTAKGNPPPSMHWKKPASSQSFTTRFIESKKGLIIHDVKMADAGRYQVSLINSVGTFTHTIQLKVFSLDDVEPANYKAVIESKPVSIECGKRPVNPGDTVTWTKSGLDLKGEERFSVDQKGYLNVNPTNKNDSGFYTCASTRRTVDGELTLSINMYLNVEFAPHIINIDEQVEVFKDERAGLPCNAIGNPGVTFRWLLPNGAVIRKNEKYELGTDGSLYINNVDMSDVGNYTCAPFNDIGDGEHGYTSLVILIPPEFLTRNPTTEYELSSKQKIIMDCSTSGIPKPTVTWSRQEEPISNKQIIYDTVGLLTISELQVSDVGTYVCTVSSVAGSINRTISLTVIGVPDPPKEVKLYTRMEIGYLSWEASYDGGSAQEFDIWHRPTYVSDYNWSKVTTNKTNVNVRLSEAFLDSNGKAVTYYFSVRSSNNEGTSAFTNVLEVGHEKFRQSNGQLLNGLISVYPLPPGDITLNMTKRGYDFKWKLLNTPGRPTADRVSIQYRHANSTTEFKTYTPKRRYKRALADQPSGIFIDAREITDVNHPLEFQLMATTPNNVKSLPVKPNNQIITGMPGGTVIPNTRNDADEGTDIAPYVLGAIFGVFIILLIISLYCFCKKRKGRYHASKNDKNVEYSLQNGVDLEHNTFEDTDGKKLLAPGFHQDSPRRFHFRTCPALKLGKFSNHAGSGSENEDVHVLLEPNKDEQNLCTCNRKYFTLNSHDVKKLKKNKKEKKGLLRSNSSPSVLLTSDIDASSIDPSELLDEEDYDLSDIEKDNVADLKTEKVATLNRSNFKDSYDQFCKPDDPRRRISSNDKPEADKHFEKDPHDISSENSATESERPCTPNDVKSYDGKSSGFGDGSNSTSDSESVSQDMHKPLLLKPSAYKLKFVNDLTSKRDMGYVSDVSTRSSPLDYVNRPKYAPPSLRHKKYHSEDEATQPRAPPSYKQAINDIERMSDKMSDKNDITDSEDLYDHLLEMERQLGVQLDDSVESDLNEVPSVPMRRYNPTAESGYMSDIGGTRYSDREKSERCAQLLNEFKSSRGTRTNNNNELEEGPVKPPTLRCQSVLDSVITEEPRVPPVLRRSNSAGSSSIYKEWLV